MSKFLGNTLLFILILSFMTLPAFSGPAIQFTDDDQALLEEIEHASFLFFWNEADQDTGLIRDKLGIDMCSVASLGFGLAAIPIGVEHNWITREQGEQRVINTLNTLLNSNARYKGMFCHYIEMDTGNSSTLGYESSASSIDTALMIAGALTAGEYFGGQVKQLADKIYGQINWKAFMNPDNFQVYMAWTPATWGEMGGPGAFEKQTWDWYTDEALLVSLLGICSPKQEHRLPLENYYSWKRPLGNYGTVEYIYTWPGTLFTYMFANCYFDFYDMGPDPEGVNWYTNTKNAVIANRDWCRAHAAEFSTYGENRWGITAGSAPDDGYVVPGHQPRGEADDWPAEGTLHPYGAGMSLPFVPEDSISALRHMRYLKIDGKPLWAEPADGGYGLWDGFNIDKKWVSDEIIGIGQGPMLLMIENARSNLIWNSFMSNEYIINGVKRVGFYQQKTGGQSETSKSAYWDNPAQWVTSNGKDCVISFTTENSDSGKSLVIGYSLFNDEGGYVNIQKQIDEAPSIDTPVSFSIKANAIGNLEIKFVDKDGSVFGTKIPLKDNFKNYTDVVVNKNNLEYWWGGDGGSFSGLHWFSLAISGKGQGTVWIDKPCLGTSDMKTTLPPGGANLDPDRELEGYGFRQRRAEKLTPKDPLVLEWLKQLQDSEAPGVNPMPSGVGVNELQTFNNALAAMAFILEGERERAERILDFYANATDRDNQDPYLQSFFYNGEARGFYQHVQRYEEDGVMPMHTDRANRWMGDMVWMLYALKHYQQTYNSNRYEELTDLIMDLIESWLIDAPNGPGKYVRHGWRNADAYFDEPYGHHEGNIDCYALFRLYGKNVYAEKIREWLDWELADKKNLPLDLFTWRVLSFGPELVDLLNVPDYDLRYRKTLEVNGQKVAGFYHGADNFINNIWLDGTGHIACAYIVYGDKARGRFYANQLDKVIVEEEINGVMTHGIPYTVNHEGGYDWVNTDKGFISVAAWYIFAKHGFNPMTLQKVSPE